MASGPAGTWTPGSPRERRYSRHDVERLGRRTEERRDPDKAAARALQWGMPILESSITLIAKNTLYYRGHDVVELSRSRSIEEVASLIWSGGFDTSFPTVPSEAAGAVISQADVPFPGALTERLRRGERIEGFGHPLYPAGDPRASALLEIVRDRYARSAELGFVSDMTEAAASVLREKPNIDFALAALTRVLRLPPGTPLTLFALGRTIGWIGHAIEQYGTGHMIRPRAKYVGDPPVARNAKR